jgi:uroporphyrinogen III methyltransferase/synthase
VSEALAEAVPPPRTAGDRVLLPTAAGARDVLPRVLAAKGYAVDVVEAYRTVRPQPTPDLLDAVRTTDAVTFTSSSTVVGWLELFGAAAVPPVVGCIGPITSTTAREAGITVSFEAEEHSIEGLVAALVRFAGEAGRPSDRLHAGRPHTDGPYAGGPNAGEST